MSGFLSHFPETSKEWASLQLHTESLVLDLVSTQSANVNKAPGSAVKCRTGQSVCLPKAKGERVALISLMESEDTGRRER